MSELLAGVRVIESAMLFNGDTVGAHLGDLGADVIKVEAPPVGDYLRHFLGQVVPGHSPAHIQINRNKRSIAIDLRKPEGLEVFWRLLDTADVFVDGNASDACDRLGIGYDEQRAAQARHRLLPVLGLRRFGSVCRHPDPWPDDGRAHRCVPPGDG